MFYIQTLKLKKDTFQALLITHRFFSCLTEIQRESRLIRKKVIPLQRRAIHPAATGPHSSMDRTPLS